MPYQKCTTVPSLLATMVTKTSKSVYRKQRKTRKRVSYIKPARKKIITIICPFATHSVGQITIRSLASVCVSVCHRSWIEFDERHGRFRAKK